MAAYLQVCVWGGRVKTENVASEKVVRVGERGIHVLSLGKQQVDVRDVDVHGHTALVGRGLERHAQALEDRAVAAITGRECSNDVHGAVNTRQSA